MMMCCVRGTVTHIPPSSSSSSLMCCLTRRTLTRAWPGKYVGGSKNTRTSSFSQDFTTLIGSNKAVLRNSKNTHKTLHQYLIRFVPCTVILSHLTAHTRMGTQHTTTHPDLPPVTRESHTRGRELRQGRVPPALVTRSTI